MNKRRAVSEIMAKYTPEDIVSIGEVYVKLCDERNKLNMKAFAHHLGAAEGTIYKLEQVSKEYCIALDKVRGMIFFKRRTIPTNWKLKWRN